MEREFKVKTETPNDARAGQTTLHQLKGRLHTPNRAPNSIEIDSIPLRLWPFAPPR